MEIAKTAVCPCGNVTILDYCSGSHVSSNTEDFMQWNCFNCGQVFLKKWEEKAPIIIE